MRDGIYEPGEIFASPMGEYWVEESNERKAMLGVIPVYMSAGNHGYCIDPTRRKIRMNFSLLKVTPNWYIEINKIPPEIKPDAVPDDPVQSSNLI